MRDSMERVQDLAGTEAVFTLSPKDRSGAEASSQAIAVVRDGACRLLP